MIARWWRSLDRTGRGLVLAGLLTTALLAWWLAAGWRGYWEQYVATNVLPPSLWTLFGIAIAHLQLHRKLDDQHQDMKRHVTERTGQ